MPGKPSRRDRKRRGTTPERRPRPAPPVSPGRIVRAARPEAPDETPDTAPTPAVAAAPAQTSAAPRGSARVRGRGVGALRRGVTSSARALESQREERIRHDSIRDLRSIGLAAVVTAAALVAAAVFL